MRVNEQNADHSLLGRHTGRTGAPGSRILAYLATEYPCVSHTFIRREIQGLVALGFDVHRVAIRHGESLVDPEDKAERERTLALLSLPKRQFFELVLSGLILALPRLHLGLKELQKLNRNSERGVLRHLAYLFEALALLSYCRKSGVEHVHVHFGNNAATVAYLARILGGPEFSMTVHGPDEFDSPVGFSLAAKLAKAKFSFAITSYARAQLRRWLAPEQWHKLHIVRCTVDPTWFASSRPIEEHDQNIVCVGRLMRNKGQLLLVDAFAKACRAGMRGDLILIGDGEMRSHIERRVHELNIANRVRLLGWQSGHVIKEQISRSKALVLASSAEGLPVVLMEAMASQRPVITTAITGVPELVEHGRHGWLAIAGDESSLLDALLDLNGRSLDDLRRMGMAAQERVRSLHSTETEIGKIAEFFERYVFGVDQAAVPETAQ